MFEHRAGGHHEKTKHCWEVPNQLVHVANGSHAKWILQRLPFKWTNSKILSFDHREHSSKETATSQFNDVNHSYSKNSAHYWKTIMRDRELAEFDSFLKQNNKTIGDVI